MTRCGLAFGLLLLLVSRALAQEGQGAVMREWATPGEQRGWFAPTTPAEANDYLARLAGSKETVTLDTLAWVDGGAMDPDSSLPVLLVRLRRPASGDRERLRVLVLSGESGTDLSGPEVGLQVVREMALGGIGSLLDDLEISIVPAANPWGLLWWVPESPSGVDLTRDHLRLRSPSTRAVHDFVRRWQPHLVVELRELGPTVYRVQAAVPRHPNVDPDLTTYGRFYLLPYVANELAKNSVLFREYVAVEPDPGGIGTPLLGADALPEGAFLTPGELGAKHTLNAFSLAGSLSIMLGVASVGGAEGLPERVQMLYESLGYLLEVAAAQAAGLRDRRPSEPSALSVRQAWARDGDRPDLVWLVWTDQGRIAQQTTDRWHPIVRRRLALPVPPAWVIEPEGREWAELVSAHGFAVERLRRDARIEVGSYPVGRASHLPPGLADELPLDSAADGSDLLVRGERTFPSGSWIVRSDQPALRLLFTLIEPWSQDAPLGREGSVADGSSHAGLYPVHRIEDGTPTGSLRTEPADLGSTRPDPH